jgi:putative transposase
MRPLRIHLPGGLYHVTLRGNHRQEIFHRDGDQDLLTRIVTETITRFSARIHAYCWMPNHIHLLVQVSETPLASLMLRIASRYARTVQKRLSTTGHFFERRYHAILVDTESYLLELIRYIHLNPVRASLVGDPGEYPWSSHHVYCQLRGEPWVTTDLVLKLWHPGRALAIAAYRQFIGSETTDAALPAPGAADDRIPDNDGFLTKLDLKPGRAPSTETLEGIVAKGCTQLDVSVSELASRSRARRLSRARAWIAHRAVQERVASICAVARLLHRNESAIRQLMARYPVD